MVPLLLSPPVFNAPNLMLELTEIRSLLSYQRSGLKFTVASMPIRSLLLGNGPGGSGYNSNQESWLSQELVPRRPWNRQHGAHLQISHQAQRFLRLMCRDHALRLPHVFNNFASTNCSMSVLSIILAF